MPNYDDLFTGQPTQQEEKPFDKTVWAARKQAEREGVYAMIDSYVQDMGCLLYTSPSPRDCS